MKKFYSEPEIEVVEINNSDIICASGAACGTGGNETSFHPF